MAQVRLLNYAQASPEARAVFDDIMATRGSDYVNNIWRALAVHPPLLRRFWGMMKEVMTRRFSRLMKEEGLPDRTADQSAEAADQPFPAWPDVILIDGGQGQMTAVRAILSELGVEDRVVAIGVAKGQDREAGRERFFTKGKGAFTLPVRDPVLYFVQRLRDEAHRFAIGSHRARRKKEMVRNPLDEISGIGPGRKRALLLHFVAGLCQRQP